MKKKQKTEPQPDAEEQVENEAESTVSDDPGQRLAQAEADRDRNLEQLQRTLADLQNFRRRRAQDLADARTGAVEALAQELLPVLDNFHLALTAMESSTDAGEQSKALDEGVRMVQGMLLGVLERRGLQVIVGEPGHDFDHEVHEAVGIDQGSQHESGRIAQVLQRGYTLGDKVLRHTRVLVAGATSSEAAGPDGQPDAEQPAESED